MQAALRLAGILFVTAGAAGVGVCICRERGGRVAALKALENAFCLIAGEISYSRISLPEIFLEMGEKMYGAEGRRLGRRLLMIGERLQEGRDQDIGRVWREEMSAYLEETELFAQEKALVLSFPEAVWFLDGQRQEAAVKEFAQQLCRRAEEAQQKCGAQDRMTMAFCLAAGVMAAILLL